jgi:HCOMODA/2-hydroxy-3-carboxy-muconic semialdehyde decarboxylase
VVGASVRLAVYRAVYTEADARLLLRAKTLGGPINHLAPQEAALMEANLAHQRPGFGVNRVWELLKAEAVARTGRL